MFSGYSNGQVDTFNIVVSGYNPSMPIQVQAQTCSTETFTFQFNRPNCQPTTPTPTRTPTKTPQPAPTITPGPPVPFTVSEPKGMVSDTSRNRLYVASRNTNSVVVWDEIARSNLATIPVGSKPWGVGLVNDRVFVANNSSTSVSVMSAATMTKMTDINLNGKCDGGPANVAVNPVTKRVYVAMYGMGRVAVIDATNNTLVGCLTTGLGTFGVAVNQNLNQLYVTNRDGMNLQVFNISSVPGSLIKDVPLGGVPFFVQSNISTNEVYVMVAFDSPNYDNANNLQVYTATATDVSLTYATVIGNTSDGGMVWVSQASGALYVAATKNNQLQIVDPVTFAIVQTISMTDPFGITENRGLGRMYISNRNINSISIVSDEYGGAPPP